MTEEKLLALDDYAASDALSDLERLVVAYAEAMTNTPVKISDKLFKDLAEHFSPKQLVELTFTIAWENCRARFDHAFGIESEDFCKALANA